MTIKCYTQHPVGQQWLQRHRGQLPHLACVLGFTETGLIEGISAAGATPQDRQYTALADGEFLVRGRQPNPCFPLPPLIVGASPVFISRAVVEAFGLPVTLFNAGLPQPPAVPSVDLQGRWARCVSSGQALPLGVVEHLLQQGLDWGGRLGQKAQSYFIVAECVVGGTTTALGVLRGLGVDAEGKVNSSHPCCNHAQKGRLVEAGLKAAQWWEQPSPRNPLALVAAVGDPMQVVAAGMAIAGSQHGGVLLAGGTQMLAVYALAEAIAQFYQWSWQPHRVVVGTTRWVAEDPTGDTIGLAQALGSVSLLASQLNFSQSKYAALRAYEEGYVKEGVGAGGCAIASHLIQGWTSQQLLAAVEHLV
ncbi:TIGR00303 family protein [Spirulina subsalsa FACHB-351]|uniref:UPF0284 protein K4A83_20510 n=1 Tax=Spirulina subsalsa FACHB-351 TaxID=234711 RepID=A0ABT3LAX0_9CYAN|nr:TIGR00303 family protein [Spirulina subsalsa]MCW6038636.1 TIGR00303 family protein [Spirulina subsalsa FACHB-351]